MFNTKKTEMNKSILSGEKCPYPGMQYRQLVASALWHLLLQIESQLPPHYGAAQVKV